MNLYFCRFCYFVGSSLALFFFLGKKSFKCIWIKNKPIRENARDIGLV